MSKLKFGIILKEDKFSLSYLAYFLFASLLFFAKGIGWYDGQSVFKITFLLAGICWAVKVILTDYTVIEMVVSAVLLGISFLSYRNSGDKGILIAAMILVGMKNIDLKKLMKGSIFVWSSACLTNIILCFAGVTYNNMSERDKFGTKVYSCNLGFVNHSVLHMSYLAFVAIYLLAFKEKKKISTYCYLMLGNILLFFYTFSFTGFLGATVCILVDAYLFYTKENAKCCKINRAGIFCCLPILLGVALLTPLVKNQQIFDLCNTILNGRLHFSKLFMESDYFTLFGCRIYELITEEYFFLDSSYVSTLAQYGVVTFIVFFIVIAYGLYKMATQEYWTEASVTIACLIAGLAEPFLFNTAFKNIALFPVGMFLFEGGKSGSISLLARFDRNVSLRLPTVDLKLSKIKYLGLVFGALIGIVCFSVCMFFGIYNFMTRFCYVISIQGILTVEGFRGVVTWGIVGAVIAYFIEWVIGKNESND